MTAMMSGYVFNANLINNLWTEIRALQQVSLLNTMIEVDLITRQLRSELIEHRDPSRSHNKSGKRSAY